MKITAIQNIYTNPDDNIVSVQPPNKKGLIISAFEVGLQYSFDEYELDHCECIATSVIKRENSLVFTAITQRNEIDEFITISTKKGAKTKHHKIRFIRS